jgi:hypothetical protein
VKKLGPSFLASTMTKSSAPERVLKVGVTLSCHLTDVCQLPLTFAAKWEIRRFNHSGPVAGPVKINAVVASIYALWNGPDAKLIV